MNDFNDLFERFESFEKMFSQYAADLALRNWEVSHSSLARKQENPSYNECRTYACEDIIKNLTHEQVTELPKGSKFHFLVRVGTDMNCETGPNDPVTYFNQFKKRKYVSFSTINHKNVSYYGSGGNILFAYDIQPSLIAHIFPMDSDSRPNATQESEISRFPSLWLSLKDLTVATLKLKTYNQITCLTRGEDGEIIKPSRIIAIDEVNDEIKSVAESFGIGYTIVHPERKALCEHYDPFATELTTEPNITEKKQKLFKKLKELYSLEAPTCSIYIPDKSGDS